MISIVSIQNVFSQDRTITGTVYNEGKEVVGATVSAKGFNTLSGFDGTYSLTVPKNTKKISFSKDKMKEKVDLGDSDVLDFAFDGNIPESTGDEGMTLSVEGMDTRSDKELAGDGVAEYMQNATYVDDYKSKKYLKALPKWRIKRANQ
jgi:hypothetical protein